MSSVSSVGSASPELSETPATCHSPISIEDSKSLSDSGLGFTLGGPDPYPRPEFTDKTEELKWMLQHMAGAFRVFARNGYLEGTAGHISIRDPINPRTFWINPLGKHFGLIKASDMVQVDEDANVINIAKNIFYPESNDNKPISIAVNKAGFKIHSELHRSRPDVWAACHAHTIYGKAYSAFGKELDMINQDVCILYKKHAVYDSFGGIVLEADEGKHIAKALGEKNKAVILKNHGLLTVGQTVDEAAFLFGLMERSCRIQLLVDSCPNNKPDLISDDVAEYTRDNTATPEILYQEFQAELEYETHLDNTYLN